MTTEKRPPTSTDRGLQVSAPVGVAGSLVVHVIFFALISAYGVVDDLGFEFELPAEVEFGIAESMAAASGGWAGATAPNNGDPVDDVGTQAIAVDAGVPESPSEPETREVEAEDDAPEEALAEVEEPGVPSTLEGDSRIPPGAQMAIRIDLERIRQSPVAEDVRRLLTAIPDWRLLLEGSGIDPITDLDRILIASPDLQRAKLVLAGRHVHDESFARNAVAELAKNQRKNARWRRRQGIPVAPWRNIDATPRVIALIGPQHFTISRSQDVAKVLALAQARTERAQDEDEGLERAHGADALLAMGPDEGVAIEVENVPAFVRGRTDIFPQRFRAAARQTSDRTAVLEALATYSDEQAAEDAREFWDDLRRRYSRSVYVQLTGVSRPLRETTLEVDGTRMRITTPVSVDHLRLLLSYIEGRLRGPRRPPSAAPRPRNTIEPRRGVETNTPAQPRRRRGQEKRDARK